MHTLVTRTTLSILVALAVTGCATHTTPEAERNPFMRHWQTQATTHEGFSPSQEDLQPEPRIIHKETAKSFVRAQKPLPTKSITLSLQDAPVPVVLKTLAQSTNTSLMLSPLISGTVSLNVVNQPWRDVFMSILKANGLDYRWTGNILQVLTIAEKEREANMLAMNQRIASTERQTELASPMSVSVVSVRYSDAVDLQKTLSKFLTKNESAVIEIDQHNNALVIQATEEMMQRIIGLVEHLDRPRAQVQLRAYIVETTKQKARELGVQWGGVGSTHGNRTWVGTGSGTIGADPRTGLTGADGIGTGMLGAPMSMGYSSMVNSANNGNLNFAFGSPGSDILEMQLHMMEEEGVLNILSSPSITTLDNKMAYTENGQKVPYSTTDSDGDKEVKFEDAVLRLEMTPNVIDRNNLKLKVLIKNDEVDDSRSVDGNPYIIKKQTETTLIVRSGETVVISGLTKSRGTGSEAGVPGLRNLPGGKYLFGSTSRGQEMQDVLIFITPTILPTRTQAQRQAPTPLDEGPSVWELSDTPQNAPLDANAPDPTRDNFGVVEPEEIASDALSEAPQAPAAAPQPAPAALPAAATQPKAQAKPEPTAKSAPAITERVVPQPAKPAQATPAKTATPTAPATPVAAPAAKPQPKPAAAPQPVRRNVYRNW